MTEEPDIWTKVKCVAPHVDGLTKRNMAKILQRKKLPPKWNTPLIKAAKQKGVKISYDELTPINQ